MVRIWSTSNLDLVIYPDANHPSIKMKRRNIPRDIEHFQSKISQNFQGYILFFSLDVILYFSFRFPPPDITAPLYLSKNPALGISDTHPSSSSAAVQRSGAPPTSADNVPQTSSDLGDSTGETPPLAAQPQKSAPVGNFIRQDSGIQLPRSLSPEKSRRKFESKSRLPAMSPKNKRRAFEVKVPSAAGTKPKSLAKRRRLKSQVAPVGKPQLPGVKRAKSIYGVPKDLRRQKSTTSSNPRSASAMHARKLWKLGAAKAVARARSAKGLKQDKASLRLHAGAR